MPLILVEVRDYFSPEMELLRRRYFSELEWPSGTSEDEFDRASSHITVSVAGELAGMVRLTKRPLSVLSAWALGPHYIPEGNDIIEATRAVVARKWRGMDLYKLMMAEATRYSERSGASRVVGAVEPDFPLRAFLATIGFHNRGEPTRSRNSPKGTVWGQVIVEDVVLAREAVSATLSLCVERLRSRGFTVRSSVLEGAVILQRG
jgi:predicted GNAT family N-acyltransferase